MNIKSKKILITGATGFVGANLVRYFLKKGADISILKRRQSNLWRISDITSHISIHNVDLLDYSKVNNTLKRIKPDVIFHAATYGGHVSQDNVSQILKTNFDGTVNLLNACLKNEFGLFVNTGSSSEYGIKNFPMQETDMLAPITPYGVSKASASIYCQYAAKKHGLPIVTLRLFSPYGYYEEPTRLIPSVIVDCLKGENPKVSSTHPVRDFIFIEDIIDAYVKVIETKKEMQGEIFNIGYGRQHSVGEIVLRIIELTGNRVKPEWKSITNPRVEPITWVADISKAKKILNWQPRYDFEKGLKKTINWFKNNNRFYF